MNTSCNTGTKYAKEIKTLDSLNTQVHKADSALSAIDSVKIKGYANHVMVSLELIRMAHIDTMSPAAAEIFRNYSSVRWSLETFLGKRAVIRNEMHKSMEQMAHLSHDLNKNLIKADSVPVYYSYEVKRAKELIETSAYSLQNLNMQLPLYNSILPKADSLTARIKKHQDI